MTFTEIYQIAASHIENAIQENSAKICLDDASFLNQLGHEKVAKLKLLKSLAYSVGILHPDYQKVLEILEERKILLSFFNKDDNSLGFIKDFKNIQSARDYIKNSSSRGKMFKSIIDTFCIGQTLQFGNQIIKMELKQNDV
jgi:hypothetical protein